MTEPARTWGANDAARAAVTELDAMAERVGVNARLSVLEAIHYARRVARGTADDELTLIICGGYSPRDLASAMRRARRAVRGVQS